MIRIPHLRWWICAILFFASSLSFLDRQVLSILSPTISEEFHMSNSDYAWVVNGFLCSYTVMFFLGGRMIDYLGTRVGLALTVGFWSLASALHGLIRNPLQLGLARFMLGVGEGGCFPGIAKGAAEWFPEEERAKAIGIAIGGSAIGAVVAPIYTVHLAGYFGWRGVFLTTGLIGALWMLLWLVFYHLPSRSPFVTSKELAHIEKNAADAPPPHREEQSCIPLKTLLRLKEVWGLMLIRFLLDPVFYFYMFWIPQYLHQERGLDLQRIGDLTWIPFLFLGLSNFAGGWLSDRLILAGFSVNRARKTIMAVAALVTPFSIFAAYASSAEMAIACMSLLMLAHGFWITNYVTVISDLFASHSVSTVMGISGMVGGIGGMLGNEVIGLVADRYSYLPIWIASGCMYPLGLLILFVTIGAIRRIEIQS